MRTAGRAGIAIALLACACSHGEQDHGGQQRAPAPSPPPLSVTVAPVVAAPAAPPRPLRVLVGGDLLPHRPSLLAPSSIRAALAPLAETFASADIVVANYEAATGEVDPKGFRLAYAAPKEWLEELPRAGIGAVTVANNHACDLGIRGVEATLAAAAAGGAIAIGGDRRDGWTARTIAEGDGKRVCAVAWTTLMNAETGCAKTVRLATASLDRAGKARIASAIARAKSSCDATIAILHGGQEYAEQTREVIDQARHAAESGADAVVIHHPHVASPVLVHTARDGREVPVFASVGNLVSNQGESWKPSMFPVLRDNRRLVCVNGWTRLGVLADLAFDFRSDGLRLKWGFHLTWTDNQHADDRTVLVPKIEARLLDPDADARIVARLAEDELGPVGLFEDACWIERTGAGDPRCEVAIRRAPAVAAPSVVARARRAKKTK